MNIFCERLKILRLEKKLTQKQAGEMLGIKENTYNEYETGTKNNPTLKTATKIADLFNTSIDYLAGRSDIRYSERENK